MILAIASFSFFGLGCLLVVTVFTVFDGEFDPGSGRTLAACLTHASRAERLLREYSSGERVSNTWVICPGHRNNQWKRWLMPDEVPAPRGSVPKVASASGPG